MKTKANRRVLWKPEYLSKGTKPKWCNILLECKSQKEALGYLLFYQRHQHETRIIRQEIIETVENPKSRRLRAVK